MAILTVYSATWCPDCLAAMRVLDERGIKYNLVDIDENPDAVDIIIAAKGKRVVPSLEYKGRFIDGNRFNRERFEKELNELLAD
ncbi:MAG: glutaredoxin family protein [Nitrospinae bacterium]|nr:glutaredoxin family protein [Nitrospinota bacterium]MBF0633428.1 glutaredoxin family protein [Nitrospinota bacterium]